MKTGSESLKAFDFIPDLMLLTKDDVNSNTDVALQFAFDLYGLYFAFASVVISAVWHVWRFDSVATKESVEPEFQDQLCDEMGSRCFCYPHHGCKDVKDTVNMSSLLIYVIYLYLSCMVSFYYPPLSALAQGRPWALKCQKTGVL